MSSITPGLDLTLYDLKSNKNGIVVAGLIDAALV